MSSRDLHEFVRRGIQCGIRKSSVGTVWVREGRGERESGVRMGSREEVWSRERLGSGWRGEGLEGEKDNIPRFSLCWYVAVGRERGELRTGELLVIVGWVCGRLGFDGCERAFILVLGILMWVRWGRGARVLQVCVWLEYMRRVLVGKGEEWNLVGIQLAMLYV